MKHLIIGLTALFFAGWILQFIKAYIMELVYIVERRRARKNKHRDRWVYDI